MADQQIYYTQFKKLLTDKPFIFEDTQSFVPLSDYLEFFESKVKKKFKYFACPIMYELDIVDQFQGKFYYTTFTSSQSGTGLNSIIQIDAEHHLLVRYFFVDKQFYCGVEMYSPELGCFLEFISKNESLEHPENEKNAGFGFGTK